MNSWRQIFAWEVDQVEYVSFRRAEEYFTGVPNPKLGYGFIAKDSGVADRRNPKRYAVYIAFSTLGSRHHTQDIEKRKRALRLPSTLSSTIIDQTSSEEKARIILEEYIRKKLKGDGVISKYLFIYRANDVVFAPLTEI